MVIASIGNGAPADYGLHAWVVMPNHVHMLGLTGQPFWQAESYDHVVGSRTEVERIEAYIIENPVRAGLARSEEEYPGPVFSAGRAEARSRLKPAPPFVTQ